jgi:hypothetical protein
MRGPLLGPPRVCREYVKEASRCTFQAPTAVRIKHPVDMALLKAHRHGLERLLGAAARSTSRGESPKRRLVDGVPHLHRGPLDAVLCQGRETDGPLAAIRLRDGDPHDGTRVGPPSLAAVRDVPPVCLQVFSLRLPGLSSNARSRLTVESLRRLAEAVDGIDRVPERRPWLGVSPPRGLS